MKSIPVIHPVIMENTEDLLVKLTPHTSVCESQNISILAMLNSLCNIKSKANMIDWGYLVEGRACIPVGHKAKNP